MAVELGSRYDHQEVEARWYERWEKSGAFSPDYGGNDDGEPYTIVIPPPNVTGELHVGHALDQTIQDVLIRVARKRGKRALWMPGMDHAGIATQLKVEKNLQAEGQDRHALGREAFVRAVWKWKEESGGKIVRQQRLMGFSLDWNRERFTMDDGLSAAVRRVFLELHASGLIYRDTRMVNWDPVMRTVLSDLEVEYDEEFEGELYSFAYPLSDGSGEIVVATTRPETMLGDTAVAVHPDDARYKALVGKTVRHPFLEREIRIIGDAELVDPEFGSGAVKVTPAHDPNDYETGRRHNLEFITILTETGAINENGGRFAGLDRYEARKAVKEALAEAGLERGQKAHKMAVGRSHRSGAVVEPMVSTQWYVRVQPLADKAMQAVRDGSVSFVSRQWERTYFHWMEEIRDWCISRQLWWGHRIPVWYGPDDHYFVAESEEAAAQAAREHYGRAVELRQDEDVLDTWFSSALWPFSTLGWPEKTEDLKTYYPTTVLVTGFDIIFFWVARMIMMGVHFMDAPPFREVYIHGLMRDEHGRKMSKTVGNVVDPLKAVEEYGADAFRFFLMATLPENKDALYSEQRLKGYQNFANKIWNSSRFVTMNLPGAFKAVPHQSALLGLELEAEDSWILTELNRAIQSVDDALSAYRFQQAAEEIYSFTWRTFCDWYIEFIKPRIFGKMGETSAESARQVAFFVLENCLALLHPFMPYITEELYHHLSHWKERHSDREQFLMTNPWPSVLELPAAAAAPARSLALLQDVIGAVRLIRAEMGIAPDRKVSIVVASADQELAAMIQGRAAAIDRLAKIEKAVVAADYQPGPFDAMESFREGQVFVSLEGVLDVARETGRLHQEQQRLEKLLGTGKKKLENPGFLNGAPADVVEKERQKLGETEERLAAVRSALDRLVRIGSR